MSKFKLDTVSASLSETRKIAKTFAGILKTEPRAVVLFDAPMGAGKTTFTSSVVKFLDKTAKPSSPTFTIINQYTNNIFHIDLYRIDDAKELANTSFNEIIVGDNYVFIEWSEKYPYQFPGKVFEVKIEPLSENARRFIINEKN